MLLVEGGCDRLVPKAARSVAGRLLAYLLLVCAVAGYALLPSNPTTGILLPASSAQAEPAKEQGKTFVAPSQAKEQRNRVASSGQAQAAEKALPPAAFVLPPASAERYAVIRLPDLQPAARPVAHFKTPRAPPRVAT